MSLASSFAALLAAMLYKLGDAARHREPVQ